MPTEADELRSRVKQFAIRIIKFIRTLPPDLATESIARQLARSGPSISANYHSSGRARSRAEFIARLGIVADEADESEHWLGVLRQAGLAAGPELEWLLNESRELRAIFVKSVSTARSNHRKSKR